MRQFLFLARCGGIGERDLVKGCLDWTSVRLAGG